METLGHRRTLRPGAPLAAAAVFAAAATLTSATPAAAAICQNEDAEISVQGLTVTGKRTIDCLDETGHKVTEPLPVTLQQDVNGTWETVRNGTGTVVYTCPGVAPNGGLSNFRIQQRPKVIALTVCDDPVSN